MPSSAQAYLREQIARIDRALAETHKRSEEREKFITESRRLDAEHDKSARRMDRWQGAIVTAAGIMATIGGLMTILATTR